MDDGPTDGAVRLLTWNLQGSQGLDVARTAAVIASVEPDVVALQEVQRRQLRALADALSMASRLWVFKHWPVVTTPEGLAVLSPHPLVDTSRFLLRRRPPWDWRRRVGVDAVGAIGGQLVEVIDIHLSPDDAGRRRREANIALDRSAAGSTLPFIVGDLNELPGGAALGAFTSAGWIDCWQAVHGDETATGTDGATNWTHGRRPGRPPTQRIDYVLAPPGSLVERCEVVADVERLDEFAVLSDHLPLFAAVRPPVGPDHGGGPAKDG